MNLQNGCKKKGFKGCLSESEVDIQISRESVREIGKNRYK